MSFSSSAKREMLKITPEASCCLKAEAYGFLLFAKSFSLSSITIWTEREQLAHTAAERIQYFRKIKKRIIKDLAYNYIPKSLLERPKQGFGVPFGRWLTTLLKDRLIAYSRSGVLKKQGLFNPSYTPNRINYYLSLNPEDSVSKNISYEIWSFFIFQLWYDQYINSL